MHFIGESWNQAWDYYSCNCTVQPEDSYPGDGINNDIEYGDHDGDNEHDSDHFTKVQTMVLAAPWSSAFDL